MKKNNAFWIIAIILFATGLIIRMHSIGYDKEIPVQARSSDAAFHILISEEIFTEWGTLPAYAAQGNENIANAQPWLLYVSASVVSKSTGIQIWNAVAVIVAIFSALSILLIYYITKKIFSETTGIIAAAIVTIPLPLTLLNAITYGFYTTIIAQTIILAQIALLLNYYEKPRTEIAALLGAVGIIQALTHFSETIIMIPITLLVIYLVQKKEQKQEKKSSQFIRDIAIFLMLTSIPFIIMIREILSTWIKIKNFGWHLIPANPKTLEFLIKVMKETSIYSATLIILSVIAAIIAATILIKQRNEKKDGVFRTYLLIIAYLIALAYIIPYFTDSAEYFIKLRYLAPVLIIPIAAEGIEKLLWFGEKNRKEKQDAILLRAEILVLILIIAGVSIQLPAKEYTPMTKEKYEALQWIEQNTEKNARIICLTGFYESNCLFAKRAGFETDTHWLRTNWDEKDPTRIKGNWMGHSLNLPEKGSHFLYEQGRNLTKINYLEDEVRIEQFNLLIIENKADTEINKAVLQKLTETKHIETIYDKNQIQIIRIKFT